MLDIFKPLAVIHRPICPGVDTFSVRLIVLPLSLIHVSVGVDQSSPSIGTVIFPVSLVDRVVIVYLLTPSIPHPIAKLTNVPRSTIHRHWSLGYQHRGVRLELELVLLVELERTQLLRNLLCSLIVEVLGLEVVVEGWVDFEGGEFFLFGVGARLALVTHF